LFATRSEAFSLGYGKYLAIVSVPVLNFIFSCYRKQYSAGQKEIHRYYAESNLFYADDGDAYANV